MPQKKGLNVSDIICERNITHGQNKDEIPKEAVQFEARRDLEGLGTRD
jgi:hypothetical protein